jgi:hypothetical protein
VRAAFVSIRSTSPAVHAWATGLLSAYFAGSLAICVRRHLDWPALAFTGSSAAAFAMAAAMHMRTLWKERRAGPQSE